MKLELKHLAPYLPYGLMVKVFDRKPTKMIASGSSSGNWVGIGAVVKWPDNCKPILRPLSDLIDENGDASECLMEIQNQFEINCYWHYWRDLVKNGYDSEIKIHHKVWEKFFEHNFDVFGLIENGLAIDVNTLK